MYILIFFNKFVCDQTKASGPCSTAVDHLLWTCGLAYVLVHVDVSMASDRIETMEQMKQKSAGFTTADWVLSLLSSDSLQLADGI